MLVTKKGNNRDIRISSEMITMLHHMVPERYNIEARMAVGSLVPQIKILHWWDTDL